LPNKKDIEIKEKYILAIIHIKSLKCGFLKESFIITDFFRNPHFIKAFRISN